MLPSSLQQHISLSTCRKCSRTLLALPRLVPTSDHNLRGSFSTTLHAFHAPCQVQAAQVQAGSQLVRQSVDAKSAAAIRHKARTARLSGNLQLALRILLDGVQQYPHDYHLIAAAASTAAKSGDAAQALHILSPALQEQPHHVRLLTAAAAAYSAQKDFTAARRCYQLAAAAHPTNHIVQSAWGAMEAAAGDGAAAVRMFQQALANQPAHAPAYVAWARLEAARGRVKEARHLHHQAHLVDPHHVPNIHVSPSHRCSAPLHGLCSTRPLQAAFTACGCL